jgi:thioredoxin-like negative regulator of GroEL
MEHLVENEIVPMVDVVPSPEPVKVLGGAVPDTKVEKHIESIVESFKSKPTTVAEAFTLLEHIALKHIEPLIDGLRAWALSEVPAEERDLAEKAFKEAEKGLAK